MKKYISAILASFCIAANAQVEEIVHARVLTIEPLVTGSYQRTNQPSCVQMQLGNQIVQRCNSYTDMTYGQRVTGYRVRFEHKGAIHTVITKTDPGEHLTIRAVTRLYVLE